MSGKNSIKLQRAIEQFALNMDRSVFISLLLVRQTSTRYVPTHGQLEILGFSQNCQDEGASGHTPWDVITSSKNGETIYAIAYALRLLSPNTPALNSLAVAVESVKTEEDELRKTIDLLSSISLNSISPSVLYENHVKRELNSGLVATGDFYTPSSLIQFMSEILDIRTGTVYDPCCGSGAMLCKASQSSYNSKQLRLYGQTMDRNSYEICFANLFLHGYNVDLGGRPENTLLEDLHSNEQFNYIVANPPFNLSRWYRNENIVRDKRWVYGRPPRTNANFAWLQHIISHLKSNGRAAVILPNGTLTTQVYQEEIIRKGILSDHIIEAIISLPEKLFYNTKVPCCIWFIDKSQRINSDVLLIDGSGIKFNSNKAMNTQDVQKLQELVIQHRAGALSGRTSWYALEPLEKIAQQKYVLSPNLYTVQEKIPLFPIEQNRSRFNSIINQLCCQLRSDPLGALIDHWRHTIVPTDWNKAPILNIYEIFGGVTKSKESFGHGFPMVDTKVVLRYPFLPDQLIASVEVSKEEIQKYGIKHGDILLNRTSETVDELACGSVAATDYHAVYGSFIKRLRSIRSDIVNPFYMAGYLRSAVYRNEVKRVSPVYTTRANMNVERLSKIFIYYPKFEVQTQIGNTLFSVFQYEELHFGEQISKQLQEFAQLLIEQFITYPVLRLQEEGDI